jgi:hypothetical protein
MWPVVNVALQAALRGAIRAVGAQGAAGVAMNLAGRHAIHLAAVAAGPIGWALTGANAAYTGYKLCEAFSGGQSKSGSQDNQTTGASNHT